MTEHATPEFRDRFHSLPAGVQSLLVRIAHSSRDDDVDEAQHLQLLAATVAATDLYYGEDTRIAMGWCLERMDDQPIAEWVSRQSAAVPEDLYHVRHACGHGVYWDPATWAIATAPYPCLWCGGEGARSERPPVGAHVVGDPAHGMRCYQDPRKWSAPGDEGIGVIHHMADDSCCRSTGLESP